MRAELENLRYSPCVFKRLMYVACKIAGIILPAERRDRILTRLKCAVHYCPSYARRVHELGVVRDRRSPQVIVSLTSYPGRIKTVHRVVTSLLNQKFKPDKVILWLGEDRFPRRESELPEKLLRLRDFGLTIGWCKDLRSYTKLVPALKKYPDDIIVTADDDVLLPPDWLERLYESYLQNPSCVHCHLVDEVIVRDGKILPYNDWKWGKRCGESSFAYLLMGLGGVLYPPHVMRPEVTDETIFMKIAPTNDDMWFWVMAILNGTLIRLVPRAFCGATADCMVNNDYALRNVNVSGNLLSDVDLNSLFKKYPEAQERIIDALK